MKKAWALLLISAPSCLMHNAAAQSYEWGRTLETADVFFEVVAVDDQSSIFWAGYVNGQADLDPGPGVFSVDGTNGIYIVKLNSVGAFLWGGTLRFSGSRVMGDIAVDDGGNVYLTGSFGPGDMDADPGTGSYSLSASTTSAFVTKISSTGQLVWAHSIPTNNQGNLQYQNIAVDAASNVIISGGFSGTVDFDPGPGSAALSPQNNAIYVTKFTEDGNFIWAKALDGPADERSSSLAVDGQNNILIGGHFNDECDVDPGPGVVLLDSNNPFLYQTFILKLNSVGDFVWVAQLKGSDPVLSVDGSDNVVAMGTFTQTVDFDPSPAVYEMSTASSADRDVFVLKYAPAGQLVWAKQLVIPANTGESMGMIAADEMGHVYVRGMFNGTADFDPGPEVHVLPVNGGGSDYLVEMDAQGNYLWGGNWTTYNPEYLRPRSMTVTDLGDIIVTGQGSSTLDLDPGPQQDIAGVGPYVLRLCRNLPMDPEMAVSGAQEVCAETAFTLSVPPDPFAINYTWILPPGWSGTSSTNSISVVPDGTSGTVAVTKDNVCTFVTATHDIVVHPRADFSYVVQNQTVTFTMLDPECTSSGEGFVWDYGNGTQNTIAPSPVWTYPVAGSYSACLLCNYSVCPACTVITVPGNYSGSSVPISAGILPVMTEGSIRVTADDMLLSVSGIHPWSEVTLRNALGQIVATKVARTDHFTFQLFTEGIYYISVLSDFGIVTQSTVVLR